jgi:hypothetical protein
MRNLLTCLLLVGVTVATSAQQKWKDWTPVPVHVTSVGAVGGRTDPSKENRDTVKDLTTQLKKSKAVRLVPSRDGALVVLVVEGRRREQLTAGFPGGAARDVAVHASLHYDGTRADLSATAQGGTAASGGTWGRAAFKIAEQVHNWIVENRIGQPQ